MLTPVNFSFSLDPPFLRTSSLCAKERLGPLFFAELMKDLLSAHVSSDTGFLFQSVPFEIALILFGSHMA